MEQHHAMQHSEPVNYKKEYIKFFAVVLAIFGVAFLLAQGGEGVLWREWMRYFMGLFFLVFALFKVVGYKAFVGMYPDYDIIAAKIKLYAYAYPFIEIGLGLLYVFNIAPTMRDVITVVIMTVGALGVWRGIKNTRGMVHCACLGNVIRLPLSTITIVEDLGMAAMATIMLLG